jgi:hypothetical protein
MITVPSLPASPSIPRKRPAATSCRTARPSVWCTKPTRPRLPARLQARPGRRFWGTTCSASRNSSAATGVEVASSPGPPRSAGPDPLGVLDPPPRPTDTNPRRPHAVGRGRSPPYRLPRSQERRRGVTGTRTHRAEFHLIGGPKPTAVSPAPRDDCPLPTNGEHAISAQSTPPPKVERGHEREDAVKRTRPLRVREPSATTADPDARVRTRPNGSASCPAY